MIISQITLFGVQVSRMHNVFFAAFIAFHDWALDFIWAVNLREIPMKYRIIKNASLMYEEFHFCYFCLSSVSLSTKTIVVTF